MPDKKATCRQQKRRPGFACRAAYRETESACALAPFNGFEIRSSRHSFFSTLLLLARCTIRVCLSFSGTRTFAACTTHVLQAPLSSALYGCAVFYKVNGRAGSAAATSFHQLAYLEIHALPDLLPIFLLYTVGSPSGAGAPSLAVLRTLCRLSTVRLPSWHARSMTRPSPTCRSSHQTPAWNAASKTPNKVLNA